MVRFETGVSWSIEGGWCVFVTVDHVTHYFQPAFARRMAAKYSNDSPEFTEVFASVAKCADECDQLERDGLTGDDYVRMKGKRYDS